MFLEKISETLLFIGRTQFKIFLFLYPNVYPLFKSTVNHNCDYFNNAIRKLYDIHTYICDEIAHIRINEYHSCIVTTVFMIEIFLTRGTAIE